jgi:hypothetical protein
MGNVPLGKPVVAVDIDGTLADYHGWFTRFAELWTGREMPDPTDNTNGIPLYKWLGMSKKTYRECKLAYRQGGMKRSMPCYPGSADLLRYMRKSGCEVWICTTRPYLRLDNIDPDTRHWLRRNHIPYDGVIFGEHKYRDLVKIVGRERVLMVLDDLPEMIEQTLALGIPGVLRDQPYNRYSEQPLSRLAYDNADALMIFRRMFRSRYARFPKAQIPNALRDGRGWESAVHRVRHEADGAAPAGLHLQVGEPAGQRH